MGADRYDESFWIESELDQVEQAGTGALRTMNDAVRAAATLTPEQLTTGINAYAIGVGSTDDENDFGDSLDGATDDDPAALTELTRSAIWGTRRDDANDDNDRPGGLTIVASEANPGRTANVSRLRSSPRVAVIGAGVIGCTVAWRIRQALGFEVDVYERRDDILLETTAGTSNRFHYGYQYALSADTATTLRDYHQPFKAVYGPCIMPSANYYGVADESLISPMQYLDFCARCDLPLEPKRPAGVFTDHVLLSLLSRERSLDLDCLRLLCREKLHDYEVRVIFATATPSMLDGYDYVISAVYGNPNLLEDPAGQQDYNFSLCEMMMVTLPDDYRGISAMIVYGPFMTIDVLGATGSHILYHGDHGIHHINVGKFPDIPAVYQPFLYRFTPAPDLHCLTKAPLALHEARRYFDGMHDARHIASNFVVRVQAPSDVRDAVRRTTIKEVQPGWFRISASKLSACVSIADRMIGVLQQQETGRCFAFGHPSHTAPSHGYPSQALRAVAGAKGGRL